MNLKYYLRGLGVGMLVTAVVLKIASGGGKESLTNEEIKTRAKELGMIENVVLSEIGTDMVSPEPETSVTAEPEASPSAEPEASPSAEPVASPSAEPAESLTEEPEESSLPEAEESGMEEPSTSGMGLPAEDIAPLTDPVSLEIRSGASSYSVSKQLAEEGVVPSAGELDTYLCANGYDKKIRVGTYTIPADADYQTIAEIITGKR